MTTRTAKVHIEVANPDHRIKGEMFADVDINAGDREPERLAVPVSALIAIACTLASLRDSRHIIAADEEGVS